MKTLILAASLAAAFTVPAAALAADNEAGVPLTPEEAAGAWTISSEGQDLCTLTLTAAHGVKAQASCNSALPAAPTGWQPTSDGVQLTGAGGQQVMAFHRWSNSLFVSHRRSGEDIQLRRGA
ncbi:MAG: AprI/Inh family metalloprotease inhibitor [Proteobacteria bacterium]|nr:AprI/Inh family metalloprotease inhibitor [Pseudomonadota bacterium]